MKQRKTQTAEYWQKQFQVGDEDIESIFQIFIDQSRPVALNDLAMHLVKRHCEEEELASRSELQDGKIYQPKNTYQIDDRVIFPALDFATGTVVDTRSGQHPEYGSFSIIAVKMSNSSATQEFAADFSQSHILNDSDVSVASRQGQMSPEEVYEAYRKIILSKVESTLENSADFVRFQDKYFLKDGLPEFHEGLFNIADAAIDINQGPLSVDTLAEQIGLVEDAGKITDATRFAVNYHLANDDRFDDVGPTGQVKWYLDRIEPPEAHHPPRRLQAQPQIYDPSLFDDEMYDMLADIDDELTSDEDAAPAEPEAATITLVLNYPHWRVGTLPLTPKTRSFFPSSQYNPVLFEFVDGQTGDTFPGWTASEHLYVYGLEQWYEHHKLPVGAYVIIKRTDDPMRVIVDYEATRTQRDWVRMAKVTGPKLGFQMNPAALNCKYDELMIISDPDPTGTDKLWLMREERQKPVFDLLCDIFPELSKLNPQSTVHVKTLYSAINVMRRVSPGIVFEELVTHECFIPMNHGYWTFDPNLKG